MSRMTLTVLNLAWTCTKHDLRSHFSKYGKIKSVRLPTNDQGFNRRVAFITMIGDRNFADSILNDYHVVDGYEVAVELSDPRQDFPLEKLE